MPHFLDVVVELRALLTATCLGACGWGIGEASSVYNVLELVARG